MLRIGEKRYLGGPDDKSQNRKHGGHHGLRRLVANRRVRVVKRGGRYYARVVWQINKPFDHSIY